MGRRWIAWVALAAAAVFAAVTWCLPYDWQPDPAAFAMIDGVALKRDHSNYWLDVDVSASSAAVIDLSRPIRLKVGEGREVSPADVRPGNPAKGGFRSVRVRFWLEAMDVEDAMELIIHGGVLKVRSRRGDPGLENGQEKHFRNHRW